MAEYIEREAAIQAIADTPCRIAVDKGKVIRTVEGLPAADVVEVVRCKDCIYYNQTIVPTVRACVRRTAYTKPDDYCSQGRKMDGKGDTQ